MNKKHPKIFVLFLPPHLSISEIKTYVKDNYSSFPSIQLDFEHDVHQNKWRLIVELSPDRLSFFIVRLHTSWLSSSAFIVWYHEISKFVNHLDDLPF